MALNEGSDVDAMISVEHVTKTFRTRRGVPVESELGPSHWLAGLLLRHKHNVHQLNALQDVSLAVRHGECLGLLGPNGAGKTTLLKCLSTLLVPDSGRITINGWDVVKDPQKAKLSITMIGSGQWVAFDWGLTVEENLQFFANLYGLPPRVTRERINAALETVGLTHRLDSTPRHLSAGERQRMVLAKGFMLRTPVVLMDEPTANLDPIGTMEILKYVREEYVGTRDRTCIFSTHRTEEAEDLCDRVAILSRGRIVALGNPRELKRLVSEVEHLEVDFSGVSSQLEKRVLAVPGVTGVRVRLSEVDSTRGNLRIQCIDSETVSNDVTRMLTDLGIRVESIRPSSPTLSDILISTSRKDVVRDEL